jgi:hypothetical protein
MTKGFIALSLLLAAAMHGAARVERYLMTKPKPTGACEVLRVTPPPAYTSFSTTDAEAYL